MELCTENAGGDRVKWADLRDLGGGINRAWLDCMCKVREGGESEGLLGLWLEQMWQR